MGAMYFMWCLWSCQLSLSLPRLQAKTDPLDEKETSKPLRPKRPAL